MHKTIVSMLAAACLVSMLPTAVQAQQTCTAVTDDLKRVGETRLRVYLWSIYDATLFTQSGAYPDTDKVALQLNYLRSIRAEQLVETTRTEWQKLGYLDQDGRAQEWLATLSEIWPDVEQGDCLLAFSEAQQGIRFYNHTGLLGAIEDAIFAEQFLAIWLSDNSSLRRNRDQLIGAQ